MGSHLTFGTPPSQPIKESETKLSYLSLEASQHESAQDSQLQIATFKVSSPADLVQVSGTYPDNWFGMASETATIWRFIL